MQRTKAVRKARKVRRKRKQNTNFKVRRQSSKKREI